MARKRMIYAELFEDEHFGSLSDKAKLLFIACIANADDDGRLAAHEANLRAYAFRYEEITLKKIKELIIEIIDKMKNFKYYEIENRFYIEFSKWKQYQYIQNDRYKPSTLPACIHPVSKMDTECSLKLNEVNIKEVNINKYKETLVGKKECVFDFEALWHRYPKKDGKIAAEKHFRKSVKTEADYADINQALDNYIAKIKRDGIEERYIKNGSTWFYNWRDSLNIVIEKKHKWGGAEGV